MADNVPITAGVGTNIAADDVSSVYYQYMKLVNGDDGGSSPWGMGVDTSPFSMPVVGPSDEFVTVSVDVTRPADTTTYAVNDCISDSTSAPTTFTAADVVKASGGSGIIIGVTAITNNDPALPLQCEVFFFDSSVTSANDNAAFAISDADAKKYIDKVQLAFEDIGNNHVASALCNIPFTCVGTDDLRFLIRARNAYIPANAEVITFRFRIQRMT